MPVKRELLTDTLVETCQDFGITGTVHDTRVAGLRVRLGKIKITWIYFQQFRFKGRRGTSWEVLGHWPAMNTADARKAALQIAARNAAGRPKPGKREAIRFDAAMADYIRYLEEKATRAGKPPVWSKVVATVARKHLLPAFGKFSLAELSQSPALVRQFHERVSKESGPIAGNQACRIITACYKFSAREDRSLPVQLPTSSVRPNPEPPSTKGLRFEDFQAWREAWEKIESPVRRGFHLVNLLSGCRPGELSRLRRSDIKPRQRLFVIPRGKSGNDIRVVLSSPIVKALRLALSGERRRGTDADLVFPGCKFPQATDRLPVTGHPLRRTYRTVAADIGINPVLTSILMSHSLDGINASYINELVLTSGPGLRAAQRGISNRIVTLLGPLSDGLAVPRHNHHPHR
jgi:integrase